MASKSRFLAVRPTIEALFDNRGQRVYRASELKRLVVDNRGAWRLRLGPDLQEFVDLMTAFTALQAVQVQVNDEERLLYTWGLATVFELAAGLRPRGYLSHHTALYLHGLVDQPPTRIFVNQEQSYKAPVTLVLTQQELDASFAKPQVASTARGVYGSYRFVLLYGKHTGQLGVITQSFAAAGQVPVTSLERTLLDITVRPDYVGGVHHVLRAYQRAAGTLSVKRLVSLLTQVAYRYPYHQAIGYYLEKAGNYSQAQVNLLHQLDRPLDFYLTHDMSATDYDPRWRIHYPTGL